MTGQLFRIFLSHSSSDDAIRRKISEFIEKLRDNFRVIFESRYSPTVLADQNLKYSIVQRIESADVVLALLSKNAVESKWVIFELEKARELNKVIIPILVKKEAKKVLEKLPWIRDLKWIEISRCNEDKTVYAEIASRITREYERKIEIDKQKAETLNKILIGALISIIGTCFLLMIPSEDSK